MRELERDIVPTPTERAPIVIVGRGRVGASLARRRRARRHPGQARAAAPTPPRPRAAPPPRCSACPTPRSPPTAATRRGRGPRPWSATSAGRPRSTALERRDPAGPGAFSHAPAADLRRRLDRRRRRPVRGRRLRRGGRGVRGGARRAGSACARSPSPRSAAPPTTPPPASPPTSSSRSRSRPPSCSMRPGSRTPASCSPRWSCAPPPTGPSAAPDALTGPIARGDRDDGRAPPSRPRRARARAAADVRRSGRADRGRHDRRGPGMKIVRDARRSCARRSRGPRREGKRIGLVPTMGYFHDGHLSLMRAAREDCDVVVVSLFVNPTQFGPSEDLDAYPRDEARDAELAEREGVDLLWMPSVEEIYPDGFAHLRRGGRGAHRRPRRRAPSGAAPPTSAASPRSSPSSSTASSPTSPTSGARTPSRRS